MKLSIALALTVAVQSCCGAPRLFRENDFAADSFAEAVNYYVTLGEEAAVRELQQLTRDSSKDFAAHRWSNNERVGWVCRVLFNPNDSKPLRQPYFGALNLPYETMPLESWPLFPVALSGSTYFVLSEGYSLAGVPEDPKQYIDYCRKNGVFRWTKIAVPTKDQGLADVALLRKSKAWADIKWTDSGENWSYTMNDEWVWRFIQKQADNVR